MRLKSITHWPKTDQQYGRIDPLMPLHLTEQPEPRLIITTEHEGRCERHTTTLSEMLAYNPTEP